MHVLKMQVNACIPTCTCNNNLHVHCLFFAYPTSLSQFLVDLWFSLTHHRVLIYGYLFLIFDHFLIHTPNINMVVHVTLYIILHIICIYMYMHVYICIYIYIHMHYTKTLQRLVATTLDFTCQVSVKWRGKIYIC